MESRYNEVPRTGKMCSLNRGLSIQLNITGLKNVARYSGVRYIGVPLYFRFVTKARSKAEITGGRANWPSQNLPPASQNTDVNK